MKRRAKFTIEFSVDLDSVRGWGYSVEDWIKLATADIMRQSHYNASHEVKSIEITPAHTLTSMEDE